MPHQPWIQKNTDQTIVVRTLGSLCCEQLQHTHRSRRPSAGCHISEAVFGPHQSKAQHCHRSSLGTGRGDLSLPRSRVSDEGQQGPLQVLRKQTHSLPFFLNSWTCPLPNCISICRISECAVCIAVYLRGNCQGTMETILQTSDECTLLGISGKHF